MEKTMLRMDWARRHILRFGGSGMGDGGKEIKWEERDEKSNHTHLATLKIWWCSQRDFRTSAIRIRIICHLCRCFKRAPWLLATGIGRSHLLATSTLNLWLTTRTPLYGSLDPLIVDVPNDFASLDFSIERAYCHRVEILGYSKSTGLIKRV
jgi:hypothetical protein